MSDLTTSLCGSKTFTFYEVFAVLFLLTSFMSGDFDGTLFFKVYFVVYHIVVFYMSFVRYLSLLLILNCRFGQ